MISEILNLFKIILKSYFFSYLEDYKEFDEENIS